MLRKKLLERLCILIVMLAVINQFASFFSWYVLVWWFDMPMHFLGGLSIFYLSAIVWLPALKYVPVWRFLYEAIITAVLLGVLWEGLELYLYLHYGSPDFVLLDSLSDMLFDVAGILFGSFWSLRSLNKL